jgi:hypothetical protein
MVYKISQSTRKLIRISTFIKKKKKKKKKKRRRKKEIAPSMPFSSFTSSWTESKVELTG